MLEREMLAAAQKLEFERAAELRDEIDALLGDKKKTPRKFRYSRRKR